MPELPEVEDAARRFRDAAVGRTIAAVSVHHPALARSLTSAAIRSLVGRRVVHVTRRAKIQIITLDDDHTMEVHFRMTGDWAFTARHTDAPTYERARIDFSDGTRISLVDSRAFAVIRVHAPGALRLPALGPEPMSDEFTVDVFARALATRRGAIKTVLLDQKVIAGVGNIYAAEALWVARIHPTRAASSLSVARIRALRDAIREVLNTAPIGRYYATDTERAAADDAWRVYGREGESCTRCARTIRRIVQGARSTYYCGGCQR